MFRGKIDRVFRELSKVFANISREGVRPDLRKLKMLKNMLLLEAEKELQAFRGILSYLTNFPQ